MMMVNSIHKGSFLNFRVFFYILVLFFLASNSFNFYRIFFRQIIFMYMVGKCPKYSGSESQTLLRPLRDPVES